MEEFLNKKNQPASEADLKKLEQILGKSLPKEYKQLLLLADGAELKNTYIKLINGRGDWIQSYDSWTSAKTQLDILINYDNKNNLFIQYQDHLFPIAITSKGNQILIGLSGEHRDKVFISDQDDDISNDERAIFPVYKVAESLTDFLHSLQANPE